MKLQITKIVKKSSRYGGHFFHTFFKDEFGNTYFTYLYPKMRNYSRWKKVLKVGTVLSGLKLKSKNLINADSKFKVEEK